MYDLSRDPAIGRLAAELLVHLRASRRNASAPPPLPVPSVWQKTPAVLDLARKTTINLVIIVIGCILIAVTIKAAVQPQFVFESIRLPTELANSGYGSNVMADRVLDRIHAINQQTSKELTSLVTSRSDTVTDRMFIGTTPQYAALSAIQVPSSSLNLQSVVLLLRDLFKPDDIRVTGDLTVVTARKPDDRVASAATPTGRSQEIDIAPTQALPVPLYVLQLRHVRGTVRQVRTVSDTDFDQLIAKAAEAILDLSDPHILAYHQYRQKAWKNVDEILDRVLGDGPPTGDVKWALTLRGQRLLDVNRSSEAVRFFEQVAQFDSKRTAYDAVDTARNGQRAIAYTNWGNALQKAGDNDAAIERYKRALGFDPRYALALYNWGNALETMRDYDRAIEKYQQAAAIDPNNAAILNSWGTVLRKRGDIDGAIAKYKLALKLNPKFTLAYNNWGLALRAKNDVEGAIEKYKQAIEVDPNYAVAYNSWGVALRVKGDPDGAIDKYERATKIDPNYAVAYNSWGVALSTKDDHRGAIEKYKRSTSIDPQYALPFYNWGVALRKLKEPDAAIEKYKRALEISPKYVNALNNWGNILFDKKDYEGAIAKYEAAVDIEPDFVLGLRNWARALEAMGKDDEAATINKRAGGIEARQSAATPMPTVDPTATAKQ